MFPNFGNAYIPPGRAFVPNTQTGAAYTFAPYDANALVVFDSGSAQTGTIPADASSSIPVGTVTRCFRRGAGLVTISPAGGVTLNKPTGIRPNRAMNVLAKLSADLTAQNDTSGAAIGWDGADVFDTDGFHDPASSNSLITIPANLGITKVSVYGTVLISLVTSGVITEWSIQKNASSSWIGFASHANSGAATDRIITSNTGAVTATAADAFRAFLTIGTDTSVSVLAAFSSFGLNVEEINPVGTIAYQYGMVFLEKIAANEWNIYGPALG